MNVYEVDVAGRLLIMADDAVQARAYAKQDLNYDDPAATWEIKAVRKSRKWKNVPRP